MPSTQYIGARYVPIFFTNPDDNSNTWKAGVAYDPLTIVTDLNQSYTSKIPVPAGVGRPSENPEYWILTGAYNAQVEAYRQDVETLETDVSNLSDDMTALDTRLSGEINTLDDRITDAGIIDNPIAVWIGDSYVQANSLGNDQYTKRFSKLVSDALGLVEKNYAVGSCGFVNGTTPYNDQVNNAYNDLTENERAAVQYVFVCGIRNDGGQNLNPIRMAATTVFTNIKTKFPKAKIIAVPALWDYKDAPPFILMAEGAVMDAFNNMALNPDSMVISKAYTWLYGMIYDILWQSGADVHPSVRGHNVIARHILSALNGSNYTQSTAMHFNGSPLSVDGTKFENFNAEINKTDNMLHFHLRFKAKGAYSAGTRVFLWQVSNSDVKEWYFGEQVIFMPIIATSTSAVLPGHIQCTSTKTSDTTATVTIGAYIEGGTTVANETYYADVIAPLAVKYVDTNYV